MTDETDRDPEELLQQSKDQDRHTSEPAGEADAPADGPDRTEAIKDALLAVEEGDVPENINIRDARLKALLVGLEEAGELAAVASAVAETADTDVDTDDVTQSDVARLLIRAGLQAGAPDLMEDATDARQQAALEQANDF